MPHLAADERRALAETLRQTDPVAPTLCGEWDAAHLAAHLVLRERSIVELAGRLPVPAFQRRAEAVVDAEAGRPYRELVAEVAAGPSWTDLRGPVPTAWLWSIPAVREQANLLEYLVHHEDVRRAHADWTPRAIGIETQVAVWKKLGPISKVLLRKVPVGLALVWPSHGEIRTKAAKHGAPTVTVTGDPVELTMLAFGRIPQTRLDWQGSEADIAAVRNADISL